MTFVVALVLCSMLTQLTSAAESSGKYPTTTIVPACAQACADFPRLGAPNCVRCLIGYGDIPMWNATHQAPIPRFPLYELGFKNIPARYSLNPMQSLTLGATPPNRVFPYKIDEMFDFYQYNAFPQTNITVCFPPGQSPVPGQRCVTRTTNPKMLTGADGRYAISPTQPLGCIEQQGWIFPIVWPDPFIVPSACPGSPNLTVLNVTFSKPEHLAQWWPDAKNLSQYRNEGVRIATQYLTNVTAAADSIWDYVGATTTSCAMWFHNVSSTATLNKVKKMYGADWNPNWDRLYRQRNLVEMDLTYSEGMNARDTGRWHQTPHILFQYLPINKTYVTLRAIAVRLSNVPTRDTAEYRVYTPSKSRSAFILAMMLARSGVAQNWINAGHIYQQHTTYGAPAWALYNVVDPGVPEFQSKNPLRIMADAYLSPRYAAEFETALTAGILSSPPMNLVFNSNELLLPVIEKYCESGPFPELATLYGTMVPGLLRQSELSVERFTSPGGKPWDMYGGPRFYLDVKEITDEFVSEYLSAFYPTDASIARDTLIQKWAEAMIDPYGGNLKKISSDNKLDTKQKIVDVISHMLVMVISHATAQYVDYDAGRNNLALIPMGTSIRDFPDPTATYTTADIVRAGPDAEAYSKQIGVTSFLDLGKLLTPKWVPYKCPDGVCPPDYTVTAEPDYEADLPYAGATSAERRANAAVVKFRKAVPEYLANTPYAKFMRTYDTREFAVMLQSYVTL